MTAGLSDLTSTVSVALAFKTVVFRAISKVEGSWREEGAKRSSKLFQESCYSESERTS